MKPILTLIFVVATLAAAGAADLPNILWITSEDNGLELGLLR